MKRAMATFGIGPHAELLEIALPSFERFANLHGYDLFADPPEPFPDRPPSWNKIPLMAALLDDYDEVLWVGADLVIVDSSADIAVLTSAWQAVVTHNTPDGWVPNCDFWLVRKPMREVLMALWRLVHHTNSPWWEQSAMLELMGYDANSRPLRMIEPTPLYEHTHFLDPAWNVHINDAQPVSHARVMHATMIPDRAKAMRGWAAVAV